MAHVPVPSQKEVRLFVWRSVSLTVYLFDCSVWLIVHLSVFFNICLSASQVEEALVRRKKMELLQRYASETLQAQSQTAKTLMGLWPLCPSVCLSVEIKQDLFFFFFYNFLLKQCEPQWWSLFRLLSITIIIIMISLIVTIFMALISAHVAPIWQQIGGSIPQHVIV